MIAKSPPESRELTAADIQELARIANVSISEIPHGFESRIRHAFEQALSGYKQAGDNACVRVPVIRAATLKQIGAVAKAANTLQTVLDDLDDNARKWLALLMNTGKSHGFEGENAEIRFAINDSAEMGGCDPAILDTARQCIGDLESAAALVHVYEGGIRASTLKTLQVEPGAAPLLNFTAFEFFVLDILEATANGLTLNKNNGSGTLVDFLQACAPFLPANFIPAAPPLSRLQQLKTHSARRNNGR